MATASRIRSGSNHSQEQADEPAKILSELRKMKKFIKDVGPCFSKVFVKQCIVSQVKEFQRKNFSGQSKKGSIGLKACKLNTSPSMHQEQVGSRRASRHLKTCEQSLWPWLVHPAASSGDTGNGSLQKVNGGEANFCNAQETSLKMTSQGFLVEQEEACVVDRIDVLLQTPNRPKLFFF
jgi:hypothetical protein